MSGQQIFLSRVAAEFAALPPLPQRPARQRDLAVTSVLPESTYVDLAAELVHWHAHQPGRSPRTVVQCVLREWAAVRTVGKETR